MGYVLGFVIGFIITFTLVGVIQRIRRTRREFWEDIPMTIDEQDADPRAVAIMTAFKTGKAVSWTEATGIVIHGDETSQKPN